MVVAVQCLVQIVGVQTRQSTHADAAGDAEKGAHHANKSVDSPCYGGREPSNDKHDNGTSH